MGWRASRDRAASRLTRQIIDPSALLSGLLSDPQPCFFWGRHERASPFAPALLAPVTTACGARSGPEPVSPRKPGANRGGFLTLGSDVCVRRWVRVGWR
jgi:hypothetical protein